MDKYSILEKHLQYILYEFIIEQTDKFVYIPKLDHSLTLLTDIIHGYQVSSTLLGEGRFGKVIEATTISTQQKCAIKVIHKQKILYLHALEKINNEIRILQKLIQIEHFIQLLDCFHSKEYIWLVFEAGTMNLYEYWKQCNEILLFQDFFHIYKSLLQGVSFLHTHLIAHRDLKLENVIIIESFLPQVKSSTTADFISRFVKIIDFGLSQDEMNLNENKQTNLSCGTVGYFAPENSFDKQIFISPYPTDIWSLGCILLQLLYGEHIFKTYWLSAYFNQSTSKIRCKQVLCFALEESLLQIQNYSKNCIVMIQTTREVLSQLHQLLFKMLQINILQRITIQEILLHELFQEITERICEETYIPVKPTENKKTGSFTKRIFRLSGRG